MIFKIIIKRSAINFTIKNLIKFLNKFTTKFRIIVNYVQIYLFF